MGTKVIVSSGATPKKVGAGEPVSAVDGLGDLLRHQEHVAAARFRQCVGEPLALDQLLGVEAAHVGSGQPAQSDGGADGVRGRAGRTDGRARS
ncbi:hypothetical protein [Amycolatopsis speibonae]|uniref:Uncharacterized protein n=1 Tax=Amycolatopsis speibonae TaxID=1450224 RepID=A0ABV7NVY7_9PSEU